MHDCMMSDVQQSTMTVDKCHPTVDAGLLHSADAAHFLTKFC